MLTYESALLVGAVATAAQDELHVEYKNSLTESQRADEDEIALGCEVNQ